MESFTNLTQIFKDIWGNKCDQLFYSFCDQSLPTPSITVHTNCITDSRSRQGRGLEATKLESSKVHRELKLGPVVNIMEVFAAMYIVCDPKIVSLDEKLNLLIVLFQFRFIPDVNIDVLNPKFTPSKPVTKAEIHIMMDSVYLGLTKLGKITPDKESSQTIADMAAKVFNDPNVTEIPSSNSGSDTQNMERRWRLMKRKIASDDKIIEFLSFFIPVINIEQTSELLNSQMSLVYANVRKRTLPALT